MLRDRLDSPRRVRLFGVVATLLTPVPYAVNAFRRPTTDVVPAPADIRNWTPPAGPIELATRVLADARFLVLGPALFLLLGVAWARNRRGWFVAGLLGLVLYGGVHETYSSFQWPLGDVLPAPVAGFVVDPLLAAIPGSVLFYAGYRLAAERESADAEQSAVSDRPEIEPAAD